MKRWVRKGSLGTTSAAACAADKEGVEKKLRSALVVERLDTTLNVHLNRFKEHFSGFWKAGELSLTRALAKTRLMSKRNTLKQQLMADLDSK